DESEAAQRKISMASPMGRALIGRRLDEEVVVRRPKGNATFTIVAIEYEG
ncbi:MAG: GreA/GreB family elongation factor, partial [Myxococcales bacterium]|nr:GreA/GreB family elongation factor [Myxococcales bacterium]